MAFVRREVDLEVLALLEDAGRNAQRAASLLHELLVDFPERVELAAVLKQAEHEGDQLTHDVIHRLRATGARPPFDPGDGHALAAALDDVVDFAEQTADWMVLYAVEAPMDPAIDLAAVLIAATEQIVGALRSLRTGESPAPHLKEINRLEDEGDRLFRDGVAGLFANGIDPMVVIRWKDILLSLESAVDACETVAHVVEGIWLKQRPA